MISSGKVAPVIEVFRTIHGDGIWVMCMTVELQATRGKKVKIFFVCLAVFGLNVISVTENISGTNIGVCFNVCLHSTVKVCRNVQRECVEIFLWLKQCKYTRR